MASKLLRYTFLTLVVLLQGCANDYSAKPIEAWVIDADTKQPIEGVNVAAQWDLEYGLEGGGAFPLTILETVSDKNGRFYFPAWGPKQILDDLPSEARLKNNDPAIQFFKSGYRVLELRNDRPIDSMWGHGSSLRSSNWDGKKIQMTKLQGTHEEYGVLLPGFYFLTSSRHCEWKYLPRMIVAIDNEYRRLKEQKIEFYDDGFSGIQGLPNQPQCGSAESFFKEYMK